MSDWLNAVVAPSPAPSSGASVDAFAQGWERSEGEPFARAIAGGAGADRLGWAFAAGYRAALCAMTGEDGQAALCITEDGGAHPRAIHTILRRDGDEVVLDGRKRWSTLAGSARSLLVAASEGRDGDRNRLRVVRVPVDTDGVELVAMPPTPFVPEIPHYEVHLAGVRVPASAVLEGDGYTRWIKPFRTVEDIHVIGAAMAFVVATGRRAGWGAALLARGVARIAALADLAVRDPLDPAVHLALGGVLDDVHAWLSEVEPGWALVDTEVRDRWQRDRAILGVAGGARTRRFERAAAHFGLSMAG